MRDATELLLADGHKHTGIAVKDNLYILTGAGFLTYDQDSHQFSLSPDSAKVDLSKKIPLEFPTPKQHKICERKARPPSDHCEKCGTKFKPGDEWHIRSFADNIQLVLCADCHAPKIIA